MTASAVDQHLINRRIEEAGTAIGDITAIADELGLAEIKERLEETVTNLRHNNLRVLAFGEFKAGKSTLLNGMLGGLTRPVPGLGNGAPLPTDDLPATAVLTSVVYGEQPRVLAYLRDDTVELWDWEAFVTTAILEPNKEANAKKFGHIKEFEVQYPSELCAKRVTLIDAPGLNEDPSRDAITMSAVNRADAALLIYRSDKFGGMSQDGYTGQMLETGLTETFHVVNLFHGRKVDHRLCTFVWERLVAPRFSEGAAPAPAQTADELRRYRIYFVDAGRSEEAIRQRDADLLAASGLPILMDDLFAFLTEERLPIFLQRYSGQATKLAADIEAVIDRTANGLRQSKADLQLAIERVEPKRQELLRKQAEIPLIVERYRLIAERDAVASLQRLVTRLIDELPGVLDQAELVEQREGRGSVFNVVDKLRAKKIADRAADVVSTYLQRQFLDWQTKPDGGLQIALMGTSEAPGAVPRMMREIEQRVAEIETDLAGIAAEVEGLGDAKIQASVKEPGKIKKGIGIALAGWTGDPGLAASGWAGDWKGMAMGVGILAAATWVFGGGTALIFAGPVGWAALAGVAAFNIMRAQGKVEKNVKEAILRAFIEGDPANDTAGLRDLPARERGGVERGVANYFRTIEEIVTKEVASAIKTQREEFEHLLARSTDDIEARDAELRRLEELRQSVRATQSRLVDIQREARQL